MQIDVRLERAQRAGQLHRPGYGALERQRREAAAQPVEHQRVRRDVGVDAERLAAGVETHAPGQHARGPRAVPVLEPAGELRVAQRPGQGPCGRQGPVQSHRGDELRDRAQVDARRVHRKRLKMDTVGGFEVHFALPADAGFGPSWNERVAERPVDLEREGRERPRGEGVSCQPSRERQRFEERPRELEVELVGVQVGVAQGDEPRVRDAERREPAGDRAAVVRQTQRVEPDLEHPFAVGAQSHVARHHAGAGNAGEAPVDESEIIERRRVRAQPQIEQQRAMRPAERAAGVAQGRVRQPHACELHIHRVTDHPQPSRRVLDSHRGVRALHGQPGDVDADAPLTRGGHLQGGEPRVEVLEATDAQPPVGVVARELEARVARLGPLRLQSQGHRPVRDADVPEQDEGGRPVRALVGTPEAQQLFDVEPAIRVLHDVDHRLTQVEFEEHDPAGREVERVVAHIDFW